MGTPSREDVKFIIFFLGGGAVLAQLSNFNLLDVPDTRGFTHPEVAHPEKPIIKSLANGKKFANHIRISTADDINLALFVYIRESYNL